MECIIIAKLSNTAQVLKILFQEKVEFGTI